jgi:hypothetical protein
MSEVFVTLEEVSRASMLGGYVFGHLPESETEVVPPGFARLILLRLLKNRRSG